MQLHWLFTHTQKKALPLESSSVFLLYLQKLKRTVDGSKGCHSICGPRGAAVTTGGGALLHLALWVRGNRDNGVVNTPDGDLWVLWKFNVTLRATCAHWGQRWARPGGSPRLPCVGTLETKRQARGGIGSWPCFVPCGMDNEASVSTCRMERWGSLSHLKRAQVTYLICPRQARDMIWSRGALSLNVLYRGFLICFCAAPHRASYHTHFAQCHVSCI